MPINIPSSLPAAKILDKENIFYISQERAIHQDIRPLKILLLNLMPKKIETETQIARLIGNTPLQVDLVLLFPESHTAKNTSKKHISNFYNTFEEIKNEKFDGLIVTGAPIEKLKYNDITYYDELKKIFEWSNRNVFSTLYICWGAQAGLYYHYGIKKQILDKKCFGVFKHKICKNTEKLFRGFDDEFYVPHSRETEISIEDIKNNSSLDLLSYSDEAGLYIAASKNRRKIFLTGHSEYDKYTLKEEYLRDKENGKDISLPQNYFIDNDPKKDVIMRWKAHSNLLFVNWLNYYVYQETPFNLSEIER